MPSNSGLGDAHLQAVVALGSAIYVGGDDGISRSNNHGLTFDRLGEAPSTVTALGTTAGQHARLLAATVFDGVWLSDDGGDSWTAVAPQDGPRGVVHALASDPSRPGLIWAGGEFGVFVSLDSGAHWKPSNAGLGCFVTSLALDRRGTLYAGCYVDDAFGAPLPPALFVSFDLGSTWKPAVRGLSARGVTALLAQADGSVLAGTQGMGVFRSSDLGRHWKPAGAGTQGTRPWVLRAALMVGRHGRCSSQVISA